jgi:hypothetical protein
LVVTGTRRSRSGDGSREYRETWKTLMTRKKEESPFMGLWHIVSMDMWDEHYLNEEVQAFIEFEANATGNFQFGYVQG